MLYSEESLSQPLLQQNHLSIKQLRVLSLNLFLRPPLVKNNESDYKDLRASFFCNKFLENYDLVCLQEVFSTMNSRRAEIISAALTKGFLYHAFSPAPGFFRPQVIDGGLLILSRFPIVETDFLGYGNGLFPDLFSYKGILYAKLQINQKVLHVFTLHVQATYPHTSDEIQELYKEVRKEQFESSVKFIQRKVQNVEESFVVLGDFNTDGKSEEYDVLVSHLKELELLDILRERYGLSPSTYGIVLESGEPEETILSHRNENSRDVAIDYIFLSKKGEFRHVVDDTKTEPFYVENQPFTRISDHYGVQTTLTF